MSLFKGDGGEGYSWRKILTAVAALMFIIATIGFLIFDLPELPNTYQAIISGVFVFYFFKDTVRNVRIEKKEESK